MEMKVVMITFMRYLMNKNENVETLQRNRIKGRKSFVFRVGVTWICLLADREAEVKWNLIFNLTFIH